MYNLYSRHLYVRIWLAVVAGVIVLTLAATWLVRLAAENERERILNAPRDVTVRDAENRLIGTGEGVRTRGPGSGLELKVTLDGGQKFTLQVMRRPFPSDGMRHGPGPQPWHWPFGYTWMTVFVGIAVALGVYPIVRRLTKRLEALQRGVQRWGEGELSIRVPEDGRDEVADLAKRFNAAAARIEAFVRSHKSLLANASHELRSPIARIRMGIELLGDDRSNAAVRDEISRNIAELDQLIDEILLSSRLDTREADIGTIESVDLIGLAAEECARVGADLDVAEGTDSATLTVPGVSRLLRRAIRNLLENARRYGAGEVQIRLESDARNARILVSDHGPGVPPELRERIFEPFYRLPGASEKTGGVGLGLALVKSIAERHSGTVRCEESEGGGGRFVITLPRQT